METKFEDGRRRVVIEGVAPEIDCGRFPVKRVVGEPVVVEADIFCDGHDLISAALVWRKGDSDRWIRTPMQPLGNDRWRGEFRVTEMGRYLYGIEGWIDHFKTWHFEMRKRVAAGQVTNVDLLIGAAMIEATAERATGDAPWLRSVAQMLREDRSLDEKIAAVLGGNLAGVMARYPDRSLATQYGRELAVDVDRVRARYSSWYEFFPRSTSPEPGRHGTFRDAEARLPYVAKLGFDVLYLPPIHPIGQSERKGPNNSTVAGPNDPGSPWAIGAATGGHTAVHPELGTLDDFRRFVAKARELGIEIALDIAFQVSPDHPWVQEHPDFFRWRPDGTVQYAENPPKKYQDIYPFEFETEAWQSLWKELKGVFDFWIGEGILIFRVDNPHTKALPFWEWVIGELKREHPELIFLAEAFTRPKVMYRLAKGGFSQSYTYFAWRNSKWELTQYFRELTQTQVREYFRPNAWPNTPDILTEHLQYGGRGAFMGRVVLAATLCANYGIYGPAFELMDHEPREHGSEEYRDSEKYQLRSWELNRSDSLAEFIARLNHIRHENPALHLDRTLRFHEVDNEHIIAYTKTSADEDNVVLTVVNLDPYARQSGWIDLDLAHLRIEPHTPFQVHDLMTDERHLWFGGRNFVQLDPHSVPAHIFRIRRRLRSERDFDYFF